MPYDPEKRHRRSIRLKGYDYRQPGAYFVTLCTQEWAALFGQVIDGVMYLKEAGRMVEAAWNELPAFYPGVDIDVFVIMPNHFHGILDLFVLPTDDRAADGQKEGWTGEPVPRETALSVGDVVQRFKTLTTTRYVDGVKRLGWPAFPGRLWQRNYYEHIIRNDLARDRLRRYVLEKPERWASDEENPDWVIAPHPRR